MKRLEQIAPTPPLVPADPERRARVQEAERWGDEEFQHRARELIWAAMINSPGAMVGYSEHSRIPLPAPAIKLSAPTISRLAARLNRTDDDVASRALQALPAQLDKIDAWIADGTIGDPAAPNVADLQICSTIRLMLTIGDARPLIEGRQCAELAMELFPDADGDMPAGSIIAAA
jgi:glutathione S-transferase